MECYNNPLYLDRLENHEKLIMVVIIELINKMMKNIYT